MLYPMGNYSLNNTQPVEMERMPDPAKENKNRASYLYRTAQPSTFAAFLPWRIKQELVV